MITSGLSICKRAGQARNKVLQHDRFIKNSIAPPFNARARIVSSRVAVMKMIGKLGVVSIILCFN